MTDTVITPAELKRILDAEQAAKAQAERERQERLQAEQSHLHEAFLAEQVPPDVRARLSRLIRTAAEHGHNEALCMRFPSAWCSDGGRAINNGDPDWPETLTGYAARGYEFWKSELQPQGYHLRARILDYPDGMPGDVGLFLTW